MRKLFPVLIVLATASLPAVAGDLQQEYIQVRKIALKDSRVQEAFEKATERLNQRILEIDPSLKPIVDEESAHGFVGPAAPLEPKPRGAAPVAQHVSGGPEHVIIKGDTLSSIAMHYHVSVAALKHENHITDEHKLKIGQKLAIPSTGVTPAPKAAPAPRPTQALDTNAPAKSDDSPSWWDEVKKDL